MLFSVLYTKNSKRKEYYTVITKLNNHIVFLKVSDSYENHLGLVYIVTEIVKLEQYGNLREITRSWTRFLNNLFV